MFLSSTGAKLDPYRHQKRTIFTPKTPDSQIYSTAHTWSKSFGLSPVPATLPPCAMSSSAQLSATTQRLCRHPVASTALLPHSDMVAAIAGIELYPRRHRHIYPIVGRTDRIFFLRASPSTFGHLEALPTTSSFGIGSTSPAGRDTSVVLQVFDGLPR